MKKRGFWKYVLILIFLTGICIRFINFNESTYFGFDEARDAYISQSIYKNGDIKLIGPPANAPGLFHGPLYWYLIGPLYIFSNGNPFFLSVVFRILNSLGIFVIFFITKRLFNMKTALIASLLYAFSFEQSQYAMYTCHPSLVVFSWLAIFSGSSILLKNEEKNFWGLPLLFGGIASALQFELVSLNTFFLLIFLLIILKREVKNISLKSKLFSAFLFTMFISTYLVSEIKFNFRSTRSALSLFRSGYSVMNEKETKFGLFLNKFPLVFKDNVLPLNNIWLYLLIFVVLSALFYCLIKEKQRRLILILFWIFAGTPFIFLGGYNAYYVNLGIGLGVIAGTSYLLSKIFDKTKLIALLFLSVILIFNFFRINKQSKNSLIVDIKPQPYMKLADELKLIDRMYELSNKRGFTIRVTGIPYRVQTVWAYLFNYYGRKRYGYYPYLETGVVEGFPGKLPAPIKGSTCDRFLVREPERGIPIELIQKDIDEENLFSTVVSVEKFGHFTLQYRRSNSKDCHNITEERI